MIVGFRHKGLKLLFEKGDRRKVLTDHADKIERILARLEEASEATHMNLPGFRLHPLRGRSRWLLVGDRLWQLADRLPVRGRGRRRRGSDRLSLGG